MLSACSVLGACFVVAKCQKRPCLITSFYGICVYLGTKVPRRSAGIVRGMSLVARALLHMRANRHAQVHVTIKLN